MTGKVLQALFLGGENTNRIEATNSGINNNNNKRVPSHTSVSPMMLDVCHLHWTETRRRLEAELPRCSFTFAKVTQKARQAPSQQQHKKKWKCSKQCDDAQALHPFFFFSFLLSFFFFAWLLTTKHIERHRRWKAKT